MNIPSSHLPHYVSKEPFIKGKKTPISIEKKRFYMASQWHLMWWKFRRHKLAMIAGTFLLLVYVSVLFSETIAPYNLHTRHTEYLYAPPQKIRIFHEGKLTAPFVYGLKVHLDLTALRWIYSEEKIIIYELRFFCSGHVFPGSSYKFWGVFVVYFHLIGASQ